MLLKAYTLKSIFHDSQYAKMRDRPQPSGTFSDRPTSATAIALLGLQHCDRTNDKEPLRSGKGDVGQFRSLNQALNLAITFSAIDHKHQKF
jgi:hypothetical protein